MIFLTTHGRIFVPVISTIIVAVTNLRVEDAPDRRRLTRAFREVFRTVTSHWLNKQTAECYFLHNLSIK